MALCVPSVAVSLLAVRAVSCGAVRNRMVAIRVVSRVRVLIGRVKLTSLVVNLAVVVLIKRIRMIIIGVLVLAAVVA